MAPARPPREDLPPPRKRLGQHFLSDPRILERIVGALALTGNETVIEIGPGRGALTDILATRCRRLIAVELDRTLAPMLARRYADARHVSVVEADVRDVALGELAGGPYVVIGNVPYYITTPILFHALKPPRPDRAVFLVQREVAERMAAAPGEREYGALTVNLAALARVELLFRIAPGAFTPPPTVESALVRVTPRPDALVSPEREESFRRFVLAVFAQRRKQMKTILRGVANLTADEGTQLLRELGVDPAIRPERLAADQLAAIEARLR